MNKMECRRQEELEVKREQGRNVINRIYSCMKLKKKALAPLDKYLEGSSRAYVSFCVYCCLDTY